MSAVNPDRGMTRVGRGKRKVREMGGKGKGDGREREREGEGGGKVRERGGNGVVR